MALRYSWPGPLHCAPDPPEDWHRSELCFGDGGTTGRCSSDSTWPADFNAEARDVTHADGHVRMSPAERALAWWMTLSFGTFVATGMAINALFTASGDICDQFHESPNTPLGWSIVIGGAAFMALIGWRLKPRRWWALAGCAIVLHLMLFSWWVTPSGTC